MASGTSGSPGDYVQAPQTVQPEVPVEEQLNQLKLAAKSKIHEFVDQANQAANDPSNKPIDEAVKRDIDATAKDATASYTTALSQLGDAFHTLESTGHQFVNQLGLNTTATATAKDLTDTTKQGALQQTEQAQAGRSAVQQGIAKVHDAMASGIAVANQKLQPSSNSAEPDPAVARAVHSEATGLLQSLGSVISSTTQSVKAAFVTPSPTANAGHRSPTPTTTNLPVTHPPAQSVGESLGQTAAALRDAIQSTWASAPDSSSPVNSGVAPVRPEGAGKAVPAAEGDAK